MTHDQIKARVCELFEFGEDKWFDYADSFIKLVEGAVKIEREACAKVCTDSSTDDWGSLSYVAEQIRMRSNA